MTTLALNPLARAYARIDLRRRLIVLALALGVCVALALDLVSGAAALSLGELVQALLQGANAPDAHAVILWQIRLPQGLMAVLVGAALGLAGAEMQSALGNPLASPMTLGVSAAATLGAALAVLAGGNTSGLLSVWLLPAAAFACAAACALLVQGLAQWLGGSTAAIVLFGIAVSFALNALVSLIQFIVDAGSLQQIVFWTMGSLVRADWPRLAVLALVLGLCLVCAQRAAWQLTALCAGEEQARALGLQVERLRRVSLLRASLLAAVAVAFVGTIGFIGLVAPHLARLLLGEDHRYYLPGAALAGALVLSLAATAAKLAVPGLLVPVGIVTALVGVPLFLALILVQRGRP